MQVAGTLTYPAVFDADADADSIYKACKGTGTNEAEINAIVGHRSLNQRNAIRESYYRKYNKDVVDVLKSETTGEYDSLLQTLFRGHLEILAYDLYKGMKGTGTNSHVLNTTICCCNNTEIFMLKKAYEKVIRDKDPKKASTRSLESDVTKETKPPYETYLLRLLRGKRQDDPIEKIEQAQRSGNMSILVNESLVDADVKRLYNAGEGNKNKQGDTDPFMEILADRSKYHIKAIWETYKQKYGRTLVDAISDKFKDPIRTAFSTTIMAQVNLRLLIVCQLYESMYGTGTDEDTLIRLICLRCESDLTAIKHMYHDFFGKSLTDAVKSETSGDFRKLLFILLGDSM